MGGRELRGRKGGKKRWERWLWREGRGAGGGKYEEKTYGKEDKERKGVGEEGGDEGSKEEGGLAVFFEVVAEEIGIFFVIHWLSFRSYFLFLFFLFSFPRSSKSKKKTIMTNNNKK